MLQTINHYGAFYGPFINQRYALESKKALEDNLEAVKNKFDNKVCIVVGGSKGIGKGIADKLTELNAKTCVVARSQVNAEHIQADLSTIKGIKKAVKDIKEKYPKIDHLFLCAGKLPNGQFIPQEENLNQHFVLQDLQRYYMSTQLADNVTESIFLVSAISAGEKPNNLLDYMSINQARFMKLSFLRRMRWQLNFDVMFLDAVALRVSKKYPNLYVANMFPGLVDTTNVETAQLLPQWSLPFISKLQKLTSLSVKDFVNVPLRYVLESKPGLEFRNCRGGKLEPANWLKDETNVDALLDKADQIIESTP